MLLFIVIYSSRSKAKNVVSIHLMLLFIEAALFSEQGDDVFQYISCYSLSPFRAYRKDPASVFQYISCYSLSLWIGTLSSIPDVSIHLMLLFISLPYSSIKMYSTFQYISCYSLSHPQRLLQSSGHVSIHLMLLFIFTNFTHWKSSCYVSIHLMLLFIRDIPLNADGWVGFQYISCYSLSAYEMRDSYISQ